MNIQDFADDFALIRQTRLEKFRVMIQEPRFPDFEGEFEMRITWNGNQYTVLALTPDEARQVVRTLVEKLRGPGK